MSTKAQFSVMIILVDLQQQCSHKPHALARVKNMRPPGSVLLMFQCLHVQMRSFGVKQNHLNLREREQRGRGLAEPQSHSHS